MTKLVLFLAITLIFAFDLPAQSKFITKEEYSDALGKAARKQENVPRRVTGVINFYDAKKVIFEKRTSLGEHLSPDTYRTLATIETNGRITLRYELIKIGNVEYTKKDDEAWVKKELSKENDGSGGGTFLVGKEIKTSKLQEYLLIPTTIDNKAANIYFQYEVSKSEDDNSLTFIESKNIISAEGLTLRWIYKVSRTIPENVSHVSTTTYEYNPGDLKIEAPIK